MIRMLRGAALLVTVSAAWACGNFQATAPAPEIARPALEPFVRAPDTSAIRVYWIGHATALIGMDDRWILTDPNFSSRIGWIEKRRVAPGADPDALPVVDWVLISHAHLDHLDPPSLARIDPRARLAVPPGVRPFLPASPQFARVETLAPWRSVEADGMRVTAVPARHSDGRYVIDGLWSRRAHTGFVVEYGSLAVFFAGDTGYDPELFVEIGRRFRIDVALIPVGPANRPGWLHALRKHVHVSPAEAMQIFADLGAQWMVPIHFGTFFKSGPAERRAITRAIAAHERADRVRLLPIGGSATFLY